MTTIPRDPQDTTLVLIECPRCEGHGEEVHEPYNWWHGSGVFVESYPCRLCDETGEVPEGTVNSSNKGEW